VRGTQWDGFSARASSLTTTSTVILSLRPDSGYEWHCRDSALALNGQNDMENTLSELFAQATLAHAGVVDGGVLALASSEEEGGAEPVDARQALGILHRCVAPPRRLE
jgi:hypothetical protein